MHTAHTVNIIWEREREREQVAESYNNEIWRHDHLLNCPPPPTPKNAKAIFLKCYTAPIKFNPIQDIYNMSDSLIHKDSFY